MFMLYAGNWLCPKLHKHKQLTEFKTNQELQFTVDVLNVVPCMLPSCRPHTPSIINLGALRPSIAVSQISCSFLMDDVPQEEKVSQYDILPNSLTSFSIMLQYTTVWTSHHLILGLFKVPHHFSLISLCSWQYKIHSSPKTRNLF